MIIKESTIKSIVRNAIREYLSEDRTEFDNGMVEVDNFDAVKNIMNFSHPGDTIYFVEIIKRQKDNPGMNHSRQFLKQYYFESAEDFAAAEQEIKNICKNNGARAYIYLNARSKKAIDYWTNEYLKRFRHHPNMARRFNNNAKALAAGRSFDAPDRPLCFVDVDSDDFKDIASVMKIIRDAGITPLHAYRSMNNGLHIILPDKDAAKKLDFSSINGDLSGLSQFYKNNAKVSLEIDKPTLLYAVLSPNGYDAQRKRFAKGLSMRNSYLSESRIRQIVGSSIRKVLNESK